MKLFFSHLALSSGETVWQSVPLSPEEKEFWMHHLVPLPKEIRLTAKVTLPRSAIRLVAPPGESVLLQSAVAELQDLLHPAQGTTEERLFTVTLVLGGPEAQPLQGLKNAPQAYRILPEKDGTGLRLVALDPWGLYYANKTLQQFVRPFATYKSVTLPIVSVRDWPDLEERGQWGSDSYEHLPWLASLKFNYNEQIAWMAVDKEGHGQGAMKPGQEHLPERGARYGIRVVPAFLHLNHLPFKGLFEAYPELKPVGGDTGAICFSKPSVVPVLTEIMVALGSIPGVEEINTWLTENLHGRGGCQCPQCAQVNRSVLETRVVLAAWQEAQKQLPGRTMRIMLSQETYKDNDKVLAEIPLHIRVGYYHGRLTYNSSRRPMIYPLLEDEIRRGRWMSVYPHFTAFTAIVFPFTGAEFIRTRMNEFVDKGLASVIGYAIPGQIFHRFNIEAAAEWSWNAKGRSAHEFALAWAVREGMEDPEKFAEWSDTIGPVEWDIYGCEWPLWQRRRNQPNVVTALRAGTLPNVGEGVFAEFTSPEQFERDLALAGRALALARELGDPAWVAESRVAEGLAKQMKALWDLKGLISANGVPAERKDAARHAFGLFLEGCDESIHGLKAWWHRIAPLSEPAGRFLDGLEALEETAAEMHALAADLGVGP